MTRSVTIDLVTRAADGTGILVIAEGARVTSDDLPALQARLYDYRDAALDGQISARFPELSGHPIAIRVDLHADADREALAFLSRMQAVLALDSIDLRATICGNAVQL